MIITNIKRVFKAVVVNFFRNGSVSLATVLISVLTLFTLGSLIFGRAVLLYTLDQVQNKVDISVYFRSDALEEEILTMKQSIEQLGEVKMVEYVSRDQAIADFKEKHKDNALILQSLDELGVNPLGAVLNIKAKQPSQYESIADFLKKASQQDNSIIDKTNYFQNKMAIDRLTNIFAVSKSIGIGISLALLIVSLLITFNTIRLAIYTSREEIGVMRLVGASNRFISWPFVVEGVVGGVIASIVATAAFYPLVLWFGPRTKDFFGGIDLLQYYASNFFSFFGVLLGTGTVLGVISSFIAVRRYLKV